MVPHLCEAKIKVWHTDCADRAAKPALRDKPGDSCIMARGLLESPLRSVFKSLKVLVLNLPNAYG